MLLPSRKLKFLEQQPVQVNGGRGAQEGRPGRGLASAGVGGVAAGLEAQVSGAAAHASVCMVLRSMGCVEGTDDSRVTRGATKGASGSTIGAARCRGSGFTRAQMPRVLEAEVVRAAARAAGEVCRVR